VTVGGRELLFSTPHGSHLYGLARPDSDRDTYEVYTTIPHARAKWARQTIAGDSDVFRIDYSTWLHQCSIGVPQALEAAFSRQATFDLIGPFRAGLRVGTTAHERYLRTIKTFALDPRNMVDGAAFKRRRHALRLALQGRQLARTGRFDPTLSPADAEWCTELTRLLEDDDEGFLDLCYRVFWDRQV
jgi:hypothetical protein